MDGSYLRHAINSCCCCCCCWGHSSSVCSTVPLWKWLVHIVHSHLRPASASAVWSCESHRHWHSPTLPSSAAGPPSSVWYRTPSSLLLLLFFFFYYWRELKRRFHSSSSSTLRHHQQASEKLLLALSRFHVLCSPCCIVRGCVRACVPACLSTCLRSWVYACVWTSRKPLNRQSRHGPLCPSVRPSVCPL